MIGCHAVEPDQGAFRFAPPEERRFKTIREVAAAVAQDEGLTLVEILTPPPRRGAPEIHWARQRAYHVCDLQRLPNGRRRWSRQQIAPVFGLRQAATVTIALAKYRKVMEP